MPRDIAVSCQVCLSVVDPVDIVPVDVLSPLGPATIRFRPCRLCVVSIIKAGIASDLIDPSEVFGADLEPRSHEAAPSEAPGNGAAADPSSPAAAPDAESSEMAAGETDSPSNGDARGPMPGGKCALDCGRSALDDDIYCGECRATLRE